MTLCRLLTTQNINCIIWKWAAVVPDSSTWVNEALNSRQHEKYLSSRLASNNSQLNLINLAPKRATHTRDITQTEHWAANEMLQPKNFQWLDSQSVVLLLTYPVWPSRDQCLFLFSCDQTTLSCIQLVEEIDWKGDTHFCNFTFVCICSVARAVEQACLLLFCGYINVFLFTSFHGNMSVHHYVTSLQHAIAANATDQRLVQAYEYSNIFGINKWMSTTSQSNTKNT